MDKYLKFLEIGAYCESKIGCRGCILKTKCDEAEIFPFNFEDNTPRMIDGAYELLMANKVKDSLNNAAKTGNVALHDAVNRPAHYTHRGMECIEEMRVVFGDEATAIFCKLNAWKYRYRAGEKDDAEQDLQKSDWYINKAKELQTRTATSGEYMEAGEL